MQEERAEKKEAKAATAKVGRKWRVIPTKQLATTTIVQCSRQLDAALVSSDIPKEEESWADVLTIAEFTTQKTTTSAKKRQLLDTAQLLLAQQPLRSHMWALLLGSDAAFVFLFSRVGLFSVKFRKPCNGKDCTSLLQFAIVASFLESCDSAFLGILPGIHVIEEGEYVLHCNKIVWDFLCGTCCSALSEV